MDTEKEKISTFLFLISIGIILTIEISIQKLPFSPLIKTGCARGLQIILILWAVRCFGKGWEIFGLKKKQLIKGIQKGIVWSAGFAIVAGIMGIILYFSGINPLKLFYVPLPKSSRDICLFYIIGGFIAPVAEELFFRGILYNYIKSVFYDKSKQWSIPTALILSTWLFVAAHAGNAGIPLPQLIGGIVFAISFEVEKSLATPIIIHSSGNLALFTIAQF